MRGQKLFIRPIDVNDSESLRQFLEASQAAVEVPSFGLMGRLVGDLVAVLAMEITAHSIDIVHLVVRPDLRRKQIGRFMIDEAAQMAVKLDRPSLIVRQDCTSDFFTRVGFRPDTGGLLRRVDARVTGN